MKQKNFSERLLTTVIISGINTSWRIIPGRASANPPTKNMETVNALPPTPSKTALVIPHTILPKTIALSKLIYTLFTFFCLSLQYKKPITKP